MTHAHEDSQTSTQQACLPAWRMGDPEREWVLVRYAGHPVGALVHLTEGSQILGRSRSCQIQLPEPEISRQHAQIEVVPGPDGNSVVYLVDKGSTNGTSVNDHPLPPHLPWTLGVGDVIRMGSHMFRIKRLDALERQFHEKVLAQSTVDQLTGVSNRSTALAFLERQGEIARRYERPLSACILDLDHFKWVNDCFGHAAGDLALTRLGELLLSRVRGGDQVGRIGGEEFLVVLPETPISAAVHLADDIRKSLSDIPITHPQSGEIIRLTCSIGVAELRDSDADVGVLLARADAALYHAKALGRNRTEADVKCPD